MSSLKCNNQWVALGLLQWLTNVVGQGFHLETSLNGNKSHMVSTIGDCSVIGSTHWQYEAPIGNTFSIPSIYSVPCQQ